MSEWYDSITLLPEKPIQTQPAQLQTQVGGTGNWYDSVQLLPEKPPAKVQAVPSPQPAGGNWYDSVQLLSEKPVPQPIAFPPSVPAAAPPENPPARPETGAPVATVPQAVPTPAVEAPPKNDEFLNHALRELETPENVVRSATGGRAYKQRKPEEYVNYAKRVAAKNGIPYSEELLKQLTPLMDLYDLSQEPTESIPKEQRADVLDLEARRVQLRDADNRKNGGPSWLARAVGGGVADLSQVGHKMAWLNPMQSKEDWQFEQDMLDTSTNPERFLLPDQGTVSKLAQQGLSGAFRMGAAALAGGTLGVAAMYGTPTAVDVARSAEQRGANKWAALGTGLAAGAAETFLFSGPVGKAFQSAGVSPATATSAWGAAVGATKTWASGTAHVTQTMVRAELAKNLIAELGTRAGGGQAGDYGQIIGDAVKQIPEQAITAAVFESPKAVGGYSQAAKSLFDTISQRMAAGGQGPSRKEAEQLGIPAERQDKAADRMAWFQENREQLKQMGAVVETAPSNGEPIAKEDVTNVLQNQQQEPSAQEGQQAQGGLQGPEVRKEVAGVAPERGGSEPVTEPPPTGPDGAPAPAGAGGGATTSTKKAVVDAIRAARGEDPVPGPEPETVEGWKAEAERRMAADSTLAPRLVDELIDQPRDLSKVEVQVLQRHYAEQNQRLKGASQDLVEARQGGDARQVSQAQQEADAALEAVQKAEQASEVKGRLWGQSGVSQQAVLRDDYSLERRLLVQSIAKGGRPLTPEEHTQIKGSTDKIAQLTEELKASQVGAGDRRLGEAHDQVVQEVAKNGRRRPEDNVREYAGRYSIDPDALLSAAEEVHQGMKEEIGARRAAKLDAHRLSGLNSLDVARIENSGHDFASTRLKGVTGEKVRRFDEFAQEIVAQHPEVFGEVSDPSRAVWDLLREPAIKELRLDDPRVLREAAALASDEFSLREGEASPAAPKKVSEKRAAAKQKVADAWDDFGKKLRGKAYSTPLDPELLVSAVKVAKAHFDLGVVTFTEFMAQAKKKMGEAAEQARPLLAAAWKQMRESSEQPQRELDGSDPAAVGRLAKQLHREVVELGTTDREKALDAVHEELQQYVPDITREQTADAMSGYGDYKQLSKDEVSAQVREHKGELQQLAKLRDMQAGQAPRKTGVERREPGDEERRLIQQVNEAKKRGGFDVTDPEHQLKTALDASKKAVRNRIADLEQEIATRERIVKDRSSVEPDAELESLRKRRDELKTIHEEIFPRSKKAVTPEQQLAALERGLDRSIAQLEADLKEGKIGRKPRAERPTNAAIEAKQAKLESLRAHREELRANDPQYQTDVEARSTAAYKRHLSQRLADYQDRVARGDFAKREVRRRVLDKQDEEIKFRIEQEKDKLRMMADVERLKQRFWWEKGADKLAKLRRFNALTFSSTLVKLMSAAATRYAMAPVRELAGGTLSLIPGISEISERAPIEGGMDMQAVLHGVREGMTTGVKDAVDTIRSGYSKIDLIHNGRTQLGEGEVRDPRSWMDKPGEVHAAMKSPVKRMAYEYALMKSATNYERMGVDIHDPLVQLRISGEAFRYAERQIFLQDNSLVDSVNQFLRAKVDPKTGHASVGSKAKELAGKELIPIRRVPANVVAETFEHVVGLGTGSARAWKAFRDGIDKLSPQEADIIMRHLKNGSLGSAVMSAVFLTGGAGVGIFYQRGKTLRKDEPKEGEIRMGGVTLNKNLTHSPQAETARFAATMYRVAESKLKKSDREKQGVSNGVLAGLLGLADEVPGVEGMAKASKLLDPQERRGFLGEEVKSMAIPGFVQDIAKWQDANSAGEVQRRDPQSIEEHVKTGIPYLRQGVKKKSLLRRR